VGPHRQGERVAGPDAPQVAQVNFGVVCQILCSRTRMRLAGLLIASLLLGCAHPQSAALTVDDEAAIEVEAFKEAVIYPDSPPEPGGDLVFRTAGLHEMICLGIEPHLPSAKTVVDPPPRVVNTLSDKGALVAPVSQCRNPGVTPPLLHDGSRVQFIFAFLSPLTVVRENEVWVDVWRGCSPSVGSTCIGGQGLKFKIVRTADGWVTQGVTEGAISD